MDGDALAKIILNKPLEEVTEAQAAALVREYPYFSAARFLQLQKLDPVSADYAALYQKAILYYHLPTTFSAFLHPPDELDFTVGVKAVDTKQSDQISNEPKEKVVSGIEVHTETLEKPDVEGEVTPLLFGPFHTVDYFASQGIKPVVDEMPKDKFGKQLKSFTDWLKTMKKIPASETIKDVTVEKTVENLAAHSVEHATVVTESMAEVWLKQGNSEKAVDTYRKLSLQNPAKSAYFAAKIQSINEQK